MATTEDSPLEPVLFPKSAPLGDQQRPVTEHEIAVRNRRRMSVIIVVVVALVLAMTFFMRKPDVAPAVREQDGRSAQRAPLSGD